MGVAPVLVRVAALLVGVTAPSAATTVIVATGCRGAIPLLLPFVERLGPVVHLLELVELVRHLLSG